MRNAERALRVLDRLVSGPPATQAELMRDLEIPRSTLSDLLAELRSAGYVPGVVLLSFVLRASRQPALPIGTRAILQELATRLEETAIFVIAVPGELTPTDHVMAVEQAESPHELRYVGHIGRLYEARSTVAGRALLAHHRDAASALAQDERTAIRRCGFALVENDSRGATTIAAPVFDNSGHAVGAVSIIGPAERVRDPERSLWPALREAAARLGGKSGAEN